MSHFQDLLNICQIEAVETVLTPTEDYLWRKICRTYSAKFFTPLHLVEEMEPEYVIKHMMESKLEDMDVEENIDNILNIINRIEDPDYQAEEDKSLDEFVKKAELEEEERLKSGKAIFRTSKEPETLLKKTSTENSLPESDVPNLEKQPTRGSINLQYLQELEGEED